MRNAWLVLAAFLACACARVDAGGPAVDTGCMSSTTYSSASRTGDLGVKDSTIDSNAGGLRLAQSFTVVSISSSTATTTAVTSITLPLYAATTTLPAGTITLKLYTNSGTVPGTVVSGSTVTKTQGSISTTLANATFTFNAALDLTIGDIYWIVLDTTYGQTNSPVLKWAADDIANGNASIYTGGSQKYEYDGSSGTSGTFGNGLMSTGIQLGFVIECT